MFSYLDILKENMMIDRKPFHEAVENFIRDEMTANDIWVVCRLLITTKIPQNHDAIIAVLQGAINRFGAVRNGLIAETIVDVEVQKREAEAASRKKAQEEHAQIVEDAREDYN